MIPKVDPRKEHLEEVGLRSVSLGDGFDHCGTPAVKWTIAGEDSQGEKLIAPLIFLPACVLVRSEAAGSLLVVRGVRRCLKLDERMYRTG